MSGIEEKVDAIWAKYDTDNSGQIERGEAEVFFADFIKEYPDQQLTKADFDEWFKGIDADSSGTISKDEMKEFIVKVHH